MIKVFIIQLEKQRTKVESLKQTYISGVQKLVDTSSSVRELQNELEAKKPKLIVMKDETTKLAKDIQDQVD